MEHRSFCDSQRAQPTLRLHSSRFVVESCDVFVETEHYLKFLETFQQFENRMKAFDPQWIAFRNFRQDRNPMCSLDKNPSLVFVTFEQYLN